MITPTRKSQADQGREPERSPFHDPKALPGSPVTLADRIFEVYRINGHD